MQEKKPPTDRQKPLQTHLRRTVVVHKKRLHAVVQQEHTEDVLARHAGHRAHARVLAFHTHNAAGKVSTYKPSTTAALRELQDAGIQRLGDMEQQANAAACRAEDRTVQCIVEENSEGRVDRTMLKLRTIEKT